MTTHESAPYADPTTTTGAYAPHIVAARARIIRENCKDCGKVATPSPLDDLHLVAEQDLLGHVRSLQHHVMDPDEFHMQLYHTLKESLHEAHVIGRSEDPFGGKHMPSVPHERMYAMEREVERLAGEPKLLLASEDPDEAWDRVAQEAVALADMLYPVCWDGWLEREEKADFSEWGDPGHPIPAPHRAILQRYIDVAKWGKQKVFDALRPRPLPPWSGAETETAASAPSGMLEVGT